MLTGSIEEEIYEKKKYPNLTKQTELGSSIRLKKSYSYNEKSNYSKSNNIQNSSNGISSGQENKLGLLSSSFHSDSSISNNFTPSTSSLVDKKYRDFMSSTPVKKQHFNPNEFNLNNSFYYNSDSMINSNNMSIYSISSINDNYNFDKKRSDNSEYIEKIEEENNKLVVEINKLKEELSKANNALFKKKNEIDHLEKSNKSTIEVLNNEIEKKIKSIKHLKEKNDNMYNEIQEKNLEIEEYRISNNSMKIKINNYETKIKNSEFIIQNLRDENESINEENISLKEQLDILSNISIEKQKLEDENEHLRMLAEEIDMENEEIDIMRNEFSGKPTLMDEFQSENSNNEFDQNHIENMLKSKLHTSEKLNKFMDSELSKYQIENRDLKEKIKLLEDQLKEMSQKDKNESEDHVNDDKEEHIDEIINRVKNETQLEMIQKYDIEKQELIQEIEHQKTIIEELNRKEYEIIKKSNEKRTKLALDKIPLLSIAFNHKIKFSFILLLTWLYGVLISFMVVEYVAYLAGDYGTCHHLANQLFLPQALLQALTPIISKPC